jgi:hypothetical protein
MRSKAGADHGGLLEQRVGGRDVAVPIARPRHLAAQGRQIGRAARGVDRLEAGGAMAVEGRAAVLGTAQIVQDRQLGRSVVSMCGRRWARLAWSAGRVAIDRAQVTWARPSGGAPNVSPDAAAGP